MPSQDEAKAEQRDKTVLWYRVEMMVDREDQPEPEKLQYMLDEEELQLLQADLRAFKENRATVSDRVYAYAGALDKHGFMDNSPGTVRLAFVGQAVTSAVMVPDYSPSDQYKQSKDAALIIRGR